MSQTDLKNDYDDQDFPIRLESKLPLVIHGEASKLIQQEPKSKTSIAAQASNKELRGTKSKDTSTQNDAPLLRKSDLENII